MKQEKVDLIINLAETFDGPACMFQALSGVSEESWNDLKKMASMEHRVAEMQMVLMFCEEVEETQRQEVNKYMDVLMQAGASIDIDEDSDAAIVTWKDTLSRRSEVLTEVPECRDKLRWLKLHEGLRWTDWTMQEFQECMETTNKLSELDAILMQSSQEALSMMQDLEKEAECLQQPSAGDYHPFPRCAGEDHQLLRCRNGLLFDCRLEGEVVHRVGYHVQ